MKPLKLAGIGCGSRTHVYLNLASQMPDRYQIVGGADPHDWRVKQITAFAKGGEFKAFKNADELLAADKFADVVVIGTQDNYHVEPCIGAMEKGYDVLLEKPIAPNPADVLRLETIAKRLGRRVLICHVLRYTSLYQKIKQIIDSGVLGEIITIRASEGVEPFHQAHSFVRGNWSVTEKSSPMIIQKSCHDMDILSWLMNRPCETVSSFGQISYFNRQHCPPGAPKFCVEGCPVGDTCQYNAERYLGDKRWWLDTVYEGGAKAPATNIVKWLQSSPWGRCVYQCDNTAVDHQVVNMKFAGGATGAFTMSAFDEGRNLELWCSEAVLHAGEYTKQTLGCDITIRPHRGRKIEQINADVQVGGYESHGGGDFGLISALFDEMHCDHPDQMRSSLAASVQSHLMGFAAEQSRLANGETVAVESLRSAQPAK